MLFGIPDFFISIAHWAWGIGAEEIPVRLIEWVANRLRIPDIILANWRGMTGPIKVLFLCTLALQMAYPTLYIVQGKAVATATLDAWWVWYAAAFVVLGLAWIPALIHDRRRGIIRTWP